MLSGLLLKESLSDLSLLDSLQITKTETWQVSNAVPGQPSTWTAVSFAVDDAEADGLAEQMSRALKPIVVHQRLHRGDGLRDLPRQGVQVPQGGCVVSRRGAGVWTLTGRPRITARLG